MQWITCCSTLFVKLLMLWMQFDKTKFVKTLVVVRNALISWKFCEMTVHSNRKTCKEMVWTFSYVSGSGTRDKNEKDEIWNIPKLLFMSWRIPITSRRRRAWMEVHTCRPLLLSKNTKQVFGRDQKGRHHQAKKSF